MKDSHPEVITLKLGGEDRHLKLGPAAFRIAKLKHGVEVALDSLDSPTFDVLAHLTWIGLLPDNPDLDEVQVMQWIANEDEVEVTRLTLQAFTRLGESMQALTTPSENGKSEKKTAPSA